MKKNETKEERAHRKAMYMLILKRHGLGLETKEDIKAWSDKFEKANIRQEDK